MKLQRATVRFSERGPDYPCAAVMVEYDGKVKYVITEFNNIEVYSKWFAVTLDRGPLAYMDTVAPPPASPISGA